MTLDNCSTNDSMMVKMQDKLPLDSDVRWFLAPYVMCYLYLESDC
jgi:hypothetical protein